MLLPIIMINLSIHNDAFNFGYFINLLRGGGGRATFQSRIKITVCGLAPLNKKF
jgi:hypothetical protein